MVSFSWSLNSQGTKTTFPSPQIHLAGHPQPLFPPHSNHSTLSCVPLSVGPPRPAGAPYRPSQLRLHSWLRAATWPNSVPGRESADEKQCIVMPGWRLFRGRCKLLLLGWG